jgi:hypothetical protein
MSGKEKNSGTPGRPGKIAPLTLRLTKVERDQLEELATGMTLSAYIRACLFAEEEKRRKRRPRSAIVDKKAAAEALALLGHSQIAHNLSQLAQAAKIGALVIEERERVQINEAHALVLLIRDLLVAELGTSA